MDHNDSDSAGALSEGRGQALGSWLDNNAVQILGTDDSAKVLVLRAKQGRPDDVVLAP